MIAEREMTLTPMRAEVRDTESPLSRWLAARGIKAVLFDFDDTLLDTNTFINRQKSLYVDYLADRFPRVSRDRLSEAMETADLAVFATHSVSKERWDGAIELIIRAFPDLDAGIFREGAAHLHAIYVATPELMPGAKETVDAFRAAAEKVGLVTHADPGWTMLKLARGGLSDTFDHIEVVDQYRNKESRDWAAAITALGVKPEETLVIGDSVLGDMVAARNAGVRYLVALPSPWEKYREGDLPHDAIRADSITRVIPAILEHSDGTSAFRPSA